MTATVTDAGTIAALLGELRTTTKAIAGDEWLSEDLADTPKAQLSELGSNGKPLQALDSAGVGFLTPMVSFLEEPLNQLRGNPDGVQRGAGEFQDAGKAATTLAEDYQRKSGSETSGWTGESAESYAKTGQELVDGVLSVAETALTNATALIKAGEVVAQVVAEVTRLITEAVGKIVPIMTQAIAAAAATFGQSIAVAIPQCVQIAVECGVQIAAKLGELLASGENLVKLVEGAQAVLKIVKQAMSVIGDKAEGSAELPTSREVTA
ncbi:WXG100 family type VII secretion target [Lentzea sp. E54]|uniref:WXG100 family type VII secretion target n=1 Tax=Lentzea xerophila TaxID=3435883 RepID=UPI003DA5B1FC